MGDVARTTVDAVLRRVPPPAARRVAVRATPDALRRLRAGHPWLYDRSIVSASHAGAPGDLAVVFDDRRRFVAIGLWDPSSPIRVKVLHTGHPTPVDGDFWHRRLADALARRQVFTTAADAARLGYRVVHGENDGLPGLVVDRYAGTLVVKVYSTAWFPHLADVVRSLVTLDGLDEVGGVVLRLGRLATQDAAALPRGLTDGAVVAGDVADGPVRFREHGLRFDADVRRGQKTGHFLDQRANRALVGSMASGLEVLDVFASTGGFGVHAAAGGAVHVHSIDRSAPTLAAAGHNMAINRDLPDVATCRHTRQAADAFEALDELARRGRRYDLVVIDPPSFAPRESAVQRALRAYGALTVRGLRVLRPGGTLVQASCSSRVGEDLFFDTVEQTARSGGFGIVGVLRTGHDVDHPVGFSEGAYLKAGVWTLEGRRP